MYSRVKRKRKVVKRDMYGMPIEESSEDDDSDDSDDSSEGKLTLAMLSKLISSRNSFFMKKMYLALHSALEFEVSRVEGMINIVAFYLILIQNCTENASKTVKFMFSKSRSGVCLQTL